MKTTTKTTTETTTKFTIEFDEEPAFIYVAENPRMEHVWLQGKKVYGWTSLELSTNIEEFPTYKLEGFTIKEQ